jgi:hypothetical protein
MRCACDRAWNRAPLRDPGLRRPGRVGTRVSSAHTSFVPAGGQPFGVQVSPDDKWAFVPPTGSRILVMHAGR